MEQHKPGRLEPVDVKINGCENFFSGPRDETHKPRTQLLTVAAALIPQLSLHRSEQHFAVPCADNGRAVLFQRKKVEEISPVILLHAGQCQHAAKLICGLSRLHKGGVKVCHCKLREVIG
ncbi:hypothetical protein SDC9_151355 [bioreactor metagenome]|uniref:Uncharacterized protein n=1 Tax=bioreactor metagenome TaxID=1076179 RepID=A0A645ESF4_9ZZZZ